MPCLGTFVNIVNFLLQNSLFLIHPRFLLFKPISSTSLTVCAVPTIYQLSSQLLAGKCQRAQPHILTNNSLRASSITNLDVKIKLSPVGR